MKMKTHFHFHLVRHKAILLDISWAALKKLFGNDKSTNIKEACFKKMMNCQNGKK